MTLKAYKILIAVEALGLFAGGLFIVYLNTYSINLIQEKSDLQSELRLEQAKTPQRTVTIEQEVNYKELFDQCSQEKISVGDELVACKKDAPENYREIKACISESECYTIPLYCRGAECGIDYAFIDPVRRLICY